MINLQKIKEMAGSNPFHLYKNQRLDSTVVSSRILLSLKRDDKRLYLVAPTGSGKTKMVNAFNVPTILIEPTNGIVESAIPKMSDTDLVKVCNYEGFLYIWNHKSDYNITDDTIIVLDEANELTQRKKFNYGVASDIEFILGNCPNPVMYMSATPTEEIYEFSRRLFIEWEIQQNIVIHPIILHNMGFRRFVSKELPKDKRVFIFDNNKNLLHNVCEIVISNLKKQIDETEQEVKELVSTSALQIDGDIKLTNAQTKLQFFKEMENTSKSVVSNQTFTNYTKIGATCYACAGIDILHKQDEFIIINGDKFSPDRIIQAAGRWRYFDNNNTVINSTVDIWVVWSDILSFEAAKQYLDFYNVEYCNIAEGLRQKGHKNTHSMKEITAEVETDGKYEIKTFKSITEFANMLGIPLRNIKKDDKYHKANGRKYRVILLN